VLQAPRQLWRLCNIAATNALGKRKLYTRVNIINKKKYN
jgi:hypothetical protein